MSHFLNSSNHYNGEDGDQPSRGSSSSTPPLPGHHNEVFLSFRGETRRGFTDHLYKRLYNAGISVFRDKEGLPVGERNWPELLKAIEASKISIPIISPDYASSEWCLNELVHILKCKKMFGQHVIPIFYKVKPSDVRKGLDVSGEESQVCKKRRHNFDDTHVQEQKDALTEVSYMTGLESEKVADGYEGELVEMVVATVVKALKKHTLFVSDELVGVEDHVEKIMNMVNVEGSNDVRVILIHGMGGIGKTTLAKVLYNHLACQFDSCSFLANIRETWSQHKGKVDLQAQLISDILEQKDSISSVDEGLEIIRDRFRHKKVLLLLDDVDCRDQLNALVGKQDWFGRRSMLIITSRINNVHKELEGSFNYELNGLEDDQSYLLFCKHAFKRSPSIPNAFHSIAKEIVSTTGGLPLAIEVIGCLLYNEDQYIWEQKLKKLKEIPDDEVQSKLKISFDVLNPEEQEIFLDIACHLEICQNIEYARHMWDSCGFYSELGIAKLISMSLIKIGKGKSPTILIHDQLRDLGREIVRQQSRGNLGNCRRLWKTDDAREVLESEEGTGKIQTLNLCGVDCTSEQFKRMTELRYLDMTAVDLEGDFKDLFQRLRWLCWECVELDFMESNFIPKKLVVLELYQVKIIEQWMGWSHMKHLRVLKLWKCEDLIALPDILDWTNLTILSIEYCHELTKIDGLDGAESLTSITIVRCKKLSKLGGMGILVTHLELEGLCSLMILPNLSNAKKLTNLTISDCECLVEIQGLDNIEDIESVEINACSSLERIGDLSHMKMLKTLEVRYCEKLLEITGLGISLMSLELEGLQSLVSLSDLSTAKKLTNLTISDCERLVEIQGLDNIEDIESVVINECSSLERIGDLSHMKTLEVRYCEKLLEITGLGISLMSLKLEHLDSLVSLSDLSNAKKLTNLQIRSCSNLVEIQGLDNAEGIKCVIINGCSSLERIGDLSNLNMLITLEFSHSEKLSEIRGMGISTMNLSTAKKLKYLTLRDCKNLIEIQGLNDAEGIESVVIDGCSSLERISDLSTLKMLSTLELCNCEKLSNVQGIEKLTSLTSLSFIGCHPKFNFPDLSSAKKLKNLLIHDCKNLVEIRGLDGAEGIESVLIHGCSSLERISDLSNLKMLRTLRLCDCEKLSNVQGIEN